MKQFLPAHKILLLLFLLLAILQAGMYFGLLRPRKLATQAAEKDLQKLQGRLSGKSWPQDGEKLRRILSEMQMALQGDGDQPGLSQQSERLLAQAGRMYEAKIQEQYGGREDFVTAVSRLDYQEEYNRLTLSLREQGINLIPQKLNLAEESSSAYNYQLMLQLWTVDKICTLVNAAEMQILTDESAQADYSLNRGRKTGSEARSEPGARISVLPLQAYFQDEKASAPYLLEFPVAISLRGELHQLQTFIESLQSGDTFLALKRFEIKALPPLELQTDAEGLIRNGPLHLEIICAGFFSRPTRAEEDE